MSFLFSQPAPGILPANSVDFSEVETISANRILGNNLGVESTIQELQVSDVATMLNLAQYAVGAASSTPTSIPVFADSNGKILSDSSGWRIYGSVLMPFADGSGDIGGSAVARPGEVWVKTRINLNSLAASQILASDGSKNVVSLDTATYPSLTELSYVKGVTSSIQTQLNGKQPAGTYVTSVGASAPISSSGGTTPSISISDFGGATSLLPGSRGSVPAPAAGDQVKFLRGDATWATAGVDTSGASDQQVLAYDSGTGLTTWQYAGKGDGNLGTNNVVVGRAKPAGIGSNSTIVGASAGNGTNANDSTIVGANAFATGRAYDSVSIGSYDPGYALNGIYIGNVKTGSLDTTTYDQLVIGNACTNLGDNSISIGNTSRVTHDYAIALGVQARAENEKNISLGAFSASGSGLGSIVIGANSGRAAASGTNNTILGNAAFNNASLTTATNNTIVGQGSATAITTCSDSVLIGQNSVTSLATGADNVYIGKNVGLSSVAATGNILIGSGADTSYNQCISIGVTSKSYGSITIGNNAQAGNSGGTTSCIAIGHSANAGVSGGDQNSIAIGNNSIARGVNSVVVGTSSYSGSADGNITIGKSSGRSSSGAIGANNTVIGSGSFNGASLTSAANNTIVGQGSGTSITTATDLIAMGTGSATGVTSAARNVLIGTSGAALTNGNDNVAIGWKSTGTGIGASGNYESTIIGGSGYVASRGTAVGFNCTVWNDAVGVGRGAYAYDTGSVAIGYASNVYVGPYSVAVGYEASGRGTGSSSALGYRAGNTSSTGGTNTLLGAYSANSLTSASGLVCLGYSAGKYSTTVSNEFFVDNQDRTNYAGQQTKSLIYGVFNATPASQTLTINAATTSTYGLVANEIGGDFDTRIEGATDQNLVFVDASTDKVGIGTSSPQEKLDVGTGNARVSNGDLILNTAGNGLKIKTGPNATAGIETGLSSVSTVTINTSKALTGSLIFVQPINTTDKHGFSVASISNGTSFTVDFSGNYTGDLAWFIINPA